MKHGSTLQDLAAEITRRQAASRDFIADTTDMKISTRHDAILVGDDAFKLDNHARRQITSHYKIPAAYSDLMAAENPELLADNVNSWFVKKPGRRMVRTLDGKARAFVSDKFFRYDNADLANSVLPVLMENQDLRIESCEITDKRLYIKALLPKIEGSVGLNDPVQAGLVISNSEIGMGSVSVQPLVYRLVCLNGMIMNDHGMKRFHVGRRIGEGADVQELFRNETLQADANALSMKLQDVVRGAMTQANFDGIVKRLTVATHSDVMVNPVKGIEVLGKAVGLNDGERMSCLENLMRDGDYSQWGAANAVTRLANTHESYDRATELEALGSKVIDLVDSQWAEVALAA